MTRRRSYGFWLLMLALALVLALGVYLLVLGLTTPQFASPWRMRM